eukprot:TRINITY_DN29052_c0_g2_i1.p1 TRINITY_DN29052_c0_g2~~TRINITY_DN29052_c0_g2_i1.p1  ORF type:complete len:611 (-),score=138.48 TRINITY_DN29052_c0_g2_i1:61-1764(-)
MVRIKLAPLRLPGESLSWEPGRDEAALLAAAPQAPKAPCSAQQRQPLQRRVPSRAVRPPSSSRPVSKRSSGGLSAISRDCITISEFGFDKGGGGGASSSSSTGAWGDLEAVLHSLDRPMDGEVFLKQTHLTDHYEDKRRKESLIVESIVPELLAAADAGSSSAMYATLQVPRAPKKAGFVNVVSWGEESEDTESSMDGNSSRGSSSSSSSASSEVFDAAVRAPRRGTAFATGREANSRANSRAGSRAGTARRQRGRRRGRNARMVQKDKKEADSASSKLKEAGKKVTGFNAFMSRVSQRPTVHDDLAVSAVEVADRPASGLGAFEAAPADDAVQEFSGSTMSMMQRLSMFVNQSARNSAVDKSGAERPADQKVLLEMTKNLGVTLDDAKRYWSEWVADIEAGQSLEMMPMEQFQVKIRRMCNIKEKGKIPAHLLFIGNTRLDSRGYITFEEYVQWSRHTAFAEELVVKDPVELSMRKIARDYGLPMCDIERFKRVFNSFDDDGSGEIEEEEFRKIIIKLMKVKNESDLSTKRLERYWREIDRDGGGSVDFPEFLRWYLAEFPDAAKS